MDKALKIAKDGWHPSGDKAIHRDSWKSDLKSMTIDRNKDPFEAQKAHQSAPLAALKDPSSFGPPPKRDSTTIVSSSTQPVSEQSGQSQHDATPDAATTPQPYRRDTTGLSTAHFPKPPTRRPGSAIASPPPPSSQGATSPPVPPRQPASRAPPPTLPPRMNENPHESTPPAPPTYHEAAQTPTAGPQAAAAHRLGRAGVSVSEFGIGIGGNASSGAGPSASTAGSVSGQVSELQQRFARMRAGDGGQSASNAGLAVAASQKRPPPPPPPPKSSSVTDRLAGGGSQPPPLPLSSKPRSR